MIVSQTPNRVTSRLLQACVLLCTLVALTFGTAYAQDYEAVGKRLRAAVEAGELTGEQARAMLGALKKRTTRSPGEKDQLHAYFEQVWAKLQAAVADGKMSAEDAAAKMAAIKKAKLGSGKKDAQYKAIGERLKAAVKAGDLTEEEARAKWAEINEEDEDEADDKDNENEADEDEDENEDEGEGDDGDGDEGIKPVPAEVARAIGKALLEASPVNFAGDSSQAVGVFSEDEEERMLGMILVPSEGMNEEDTEMEVGDSEPFALLFCSPSIRPVNDGGTLIERDKLHSVTITDGEGNEHDSNCMMLIVKRIADDDYRLYGIGKHATEPLIDARFDDGEGPGDTPLAVEVKDIDEESETAAVVITVFNKYQAAFRAGVAE